MSSLMVMFQLFEIENSKSPDLLRPLRGLAEHTVASKEDFRLVFGLLISTT